MLAVAFGPIGSPRRGHGDRGAHGWCAVGLQRALLGLAAALNALAQVLHVCPPGLSLCFCHRRLFP